MKNIIRGERARIEVNGYFYIATAQVPLSRGDTMEVVSVEGSRRSDMTVRKIWIHLHMQ